MTPEEIPRLVEQLDDLKNAITTQFHLDASWAAASKRAADEAPETQVKIDADEEEEVEVVEEEEEEEQEDDKGGHVGSPTGGPRPQGKKKGPSPTSGACYARGRKCSIRASASPKLR